MADFLDIDNIFFVVMGYPMSYVEFFGTLAGAVAVWLSARAQVLNFPIGLVNVVLFFFLFYQVRLYPDMFLYFFFFVTNIVGWWRWTHPKKFEEDRKRELRVSFMKRRQFLVVLILGVIGTLAFGTFADNIHDIFPRVFPEPSAFPYLDSFVAVMSVITTFLVINKKIESWILWIVIDATATGMYFAKGIKFVGLQYMAFTVIAVFGLIHWMREHKTYTR